MFIKDPRLLGNIYTWERPKQFGQLAFGNGFSMGISVDWLEFLVIHNYSFLKVTQKGKSAKVQRWFVRLRKPISKIYKTFPSASVILHSRLLQMWWGISVIN